MQFGYYAKSAQADWDAGVDLQSTSAMSLDFKSKVDCATAMFQLSAIRRRRTVTLQ
jgi:hypothetical protein